MVKPDVGERGAGVVFARSRDELAAALAATAADSIVQELAPGREFGIFYVRHPDQAHGRIFSITEKVLPVLHGDGRRTIEELILDDARAVCLARTHLARFAARRDEVPPAGSAIPPGRGRHAQPRRDLQGRRLGDGRRRSRPRSTRSASATRASSSGATTCASSALEDLLAGRGFKIVELNGLTAEATHIYHPGSSLRAAYRVLFEQWRIAFAIGHANRARGARADAAPRAGAPGPASALAGVESAPLPVAQAAPGACRNDR